MANTKEYQKLLEPPNKPKKTTYNPRNEKMHGLCHKPKHLKKQCHWNPKNPNNKLKEKKRVSVNEIFPHTGRRMSDNHKKHGNQNQRSSPQFAVISFVIH